MKRKTTRSLKTKRLKRQRTSSASNAWCKEDRISNLPQPILHDILSRLPTKDATKTCVLSETWNSTWNSFHILDFNHYQFRKAMYKRKGSKFPGFKQAARDFCNYIHNTINRRRETTETSVREFKLLVQFQGRGLKDHSRDIDSFLDYALTNNVQNLVLYDHTFLSRMKKKQEQRYLIPPSLFQAKSMKELELRGCRFLDDYYPKSLSSAYNYGIGFSLKTLKLSSVHIPEQTFQSMVSNCRLLEGLTIKCCCGFGAVRIDNSPGLKTVHLCFAKDETQTVAINDAPNLRSLSYEGCSDNVLRSMKASNCKRNVKELKFYFVELTNELVRVTTKEFPMLEKLELVWCGCEPLDYGFCISSDRLLELCFCTCYHLKEISLDTKALKLLKLGERDRCVPVALWNVPDDLLIEFV